MAALGPRDCAVAGAPRRVAGRRLGPCNRAARPACVRSPRAAGVWRVGPGGAWVGSAGGTALDTVWEPGSEAVRGGGPARRARGAALARGWAGGLSLPCLGGVALLVCLFSLVVVVFCFLL